MARLKVLKLAVCAMLLLASANVAVAQTWVNGPVTGFGYWRFDGEYFPGTGKVYFLGGRLTDLSTSGAVWSFDPIAGTYAATGATMPTPISNYDICMLRDDYNLPAGDTYGLYIFAGRINSGANTDVVQAYYPRSNTVRTISTDPFPGRISGYMYSAQASITYNNMAYVYGGFYATTFLTTAQTWVFDPLGPSGGKWTQLADLPWNRCYVGCAVVDSMIYALGGDTADAGTAYLYAKADCAVLNGNDPASNWAPIASLPQITGETRAFGFNYDSEYEYANQIIVAGQGQWPEETPVCYNYDVASNAWNSFPNLILARRNHAGAFIPGWQNSNGVPGMWVWGGHYVADSAVRTSEYLQMTSTAIGEGGKARTASRLSVAPSPVTGTGRVSFELPRPSRVELVLFDIMGRPVNTLVSGRVDAGRHTALLDAGKLKAGIYVLRLDAAGVTETRKVVVQ